MMHIKAEHLSKSFHGRPVVSDLSLEARSGFILGVLGGSSSGKSTLLRMLLNIIKPDEGTVAFDDAIINARIRNRIGYLPQRRGLLQEYSLSKMLVHFARLKNLSKKKAGVEAVRLLDKFDLIEEMETPVVELPDDIKQQVELMGAIIHNPDVLIFDEPFSGLTSANHQLFCKLMRRFREEGKTVIVATEAFKVAETICDDVVLLYDGKIVLQNSLKKIQEGYQENIILVEAEENLKFLQDIYGVKKMVQEQQAARLYVDQKVSLNKVLDTIIKSVNISRIEINRTGLKDIYEQKSTRQTEVKK